MTQAQLNQLFQRANCGAIAARRATSIVQQFGDDSVTVLVDGSSVNWYLNNRQIAWDRLVSQCDDF
ncbi:MAG: hypothetical protein JSV72_11660 [Ralstonia sp.]|jgi:hypothetical protein|nr:MAG: hypothetical protein JSV72_11660 [Ralstonia sp.]